MSEPGRRGTDAARCERAARASTVQVIGIVAAAPAATLLVAFWPTCQAVGDMPERALFVWLALVALITLGTIVHLPGEWSRALVRAGGVGFLVFIAATFVADSTTGSVDRGRQKRTMSDLRTIATVIESAFIDHGTDVPAMASVEELATFVGHDLPLVDGWGTPYELRIVGTEHCLVSFGTCGEPDRPRVGAGPCDQYEDGPTGRWSADIVFRNGSFATWPEGTQE